MENCIDCPATCFGNELDSSCISHDGKSLRYIVDELTTTPPETSSGSNTITSDDVISKSKIRNTSYICSSNIVNRTGKYTLSVTSSTTVFGWNVLDIIGDLPDGYEFATISVRITGSASGSNLISQSSSPSAGVNIKLDQYPISVDFLIRVTSPCGDIDLKKTINIVSTTGSKGTYNFIMDVKDLNPQFGEISLTDQLNSLEDQVNKVSIKLDTIEVPTHTIKTIQSDISDLKIKLGNLSTLSVTYVNDGSNQSNKLSDIVSDLYLEISNLQNVVNEQQVELESLRSQIDSI